MSCFSMQYFANACIAAILKKSEIVTGKKTSKRHAHTLDFVSDL